MSADTKTDNQNIVSLMRELRPLLPGEVKKVGATTYEIDDKIELRLNYYCRRFDKEDRREKTCLPASVTICVMERSETIKKALGITSEWQWYTRSAVYHTRTIQKSKLSGFNCESIAVAVTKALEGVDTYIEKSKTAKVERAARKKRINGEVDRIAKLLSLGKETEKSSDGGLYIRALQTSISVHEPWEKGDRDAPGQRFSYTIQYCKLTTEELHLLIEPLKKILANKKRQDKKK